MHSTILSHVLKHSFYSPKKRKSVAKRCKALLKCLESESDSEDDFKTPLKNLNEMLRKVAVYRSTKKHKKAKNIVQEINSQESNISSVATLSGSKYSDVYRLMKTPKKREVNKEYKRRFSDEQKIEATNIYLDEEVSYCLPDRKYSKLRFMSCTIEEAYKNHYLVKSRFKRKLGLTSFTSLKPSFVKKVRQTPLRGCKCEYCQNLGLLRESMIGIGFKGIPKNHSCSIKTTWCKFRSNSEIPHDYDGCDEIHESITSDQLPSKKCVLRKCNACGIDNYRKALKDLNKNILKKNATAFWSQWGIGKVFNGRKTVKRWMLQKESGSCLILLNKYLEQLNEISSHQFMKIWQLKQFNISLQNLRKGQVLLVHDFSQNLLLYAQDEVTAAHWDHEQVTLHPTVVYYVGPCGKMIKEEVIHMTNNRKHIEKTVAVFQKKTIEFLKSKKVPILEILEWTDNAPSQYKSRNCFQRMSLMKYPITRNFFGEKHGKGPSDRAGACFKTYVSKIVKSKKATFPTIEDLASYCTDNYERQVECPGNCEGEKSPKTDKIHNLRKIIYSPNIDSKGIDKLVTVEGTRKIHSVRNTGTKGVLEKRMFTCCCEKCMFGVGECAFPDYSEEWKLVSVLGKRHLKSFVKSGRVGAIQKWRNTKTKSIRIQNQVSNLKRHECNPKSNVRKSARRKLSMVESDINVSNIKSSASNTATKTTKSTASHTATKTASTIATKAATTADCPFNWTKMLDKLHKARSYDKIVQLVHDNVLPPIELNKKYQQSSDDKTDPVAMHFFPNDHPPNVVPTQTLGDGNCFPRALSNALFGTQNRHVEIRVRLVFEAVLNEQFYLSNEYLSLGVQGRLPARPNLRAPSTTVVSRYCMYSGDDYVTGYRMLVEEMRGVYRRDIVRIGRKGGFMGIWQFHQAAEISKNPICGVYPDGKGKVKVNANLRLDMNRVFLTNNPAFHNMRPIYIMWTPVSVLSKAFDVNHFVVLLEPYR